MDITPDLTETAAQPAAEGVLPSDPSSFTVFRATMRAARAAREAQMAETAAQLAAEGVDLIDLRAIQVTLEAHSAPWDACEVQKAALATQLTAEGIDLADLTAIRAALEARKAQSDVVYEEDEPLREACDAWFESVDPRTDPEVGPRYQSALARELNAQIEYLEDRIEDLVRTRRQAATEAVAALYDHVHGCLLGCCEEGLGAARAILDGVAADDPSDEHAVERLLLELSVLIDLSR